MKSVAVIGTGIMGAGIASNFLKNGYKVFVWNRNKDRVKDLIKKGAISVSSPKEAAKMADLIFEVTANDQSSESVWLGKDGIIAGATPNKTLITCATLSASWTDKLSSFCAKKNLTFFDMAMTGGRQGAEAGKLILLVGGNKTKLKSLEKDLKAISEKIFYFGKTGSGMRYKLILNSLQAIHIAGFGEALKLAKTAGLDLKAVGDALAERPGGIPTNVAWRDFQNEPNPINFSVEWITKDLNYAKAIKRGVKSPLLDETLKKFKTAIKKKLGQKDWTVINKLKD